MSAPLTSQEKQVLMRLAREALQAAVTGSRLPPLDLKGFSERLGSPGATFVTLTRRGALRGCIGALQAQIPLAEDVRQHAVAAALDDFRFPPVQPNELDQIEIEVSVLTEPEPLRYDGPEDLIRRLRPDVDGVILTSGAHRATFLPQVWEKVPAPELFLDMLCEKAGLPDNSWREGHLQVSTYQVESFHETEVPPA
jgi:AmmeMemoRadiSam system protein A